MGKPGYLMFATHTITDGGSDIRSEGTAASSTNTYYSKKFQISEAMGLGFSLKTSGTLTGAFTLWYTDIEDPNETDDDDWYNDTAITFTDPAGADLALSKYSVTDLKGKWWRVKYVNASGTGNIYGYAAGSL